MNESDRTHSPEARDALDSRDGLGPNQAPTVEQSPTSESPAGVAALFARLGLTAFGGPAAHIALFEEEFVTRRRWLSRQHFLDLLGATHLVPGPNSTEMAIHLGYVRLGWVGAVAAGVGFIVPAVLAVLAVAWAYVRYGSLPAAEQVLSGITPVVVAIIGGAAWRLGRKALGGPWPIVVALVVFALALATPLSELWLLLGAAIAGLAPHWLKRLRGAAGGFAVALGIGGTSSAGSPWPADAMMALAGTGGAPVPIAGRLLAATEASAPALLAIFLVFLRIGALLFGSGYVLIAYLERAVVEQRGWLEAQQLLDAIAAGQITPGPVLATAAFVGYLLRGVPGAAVATVGIFLPSFLIVLAMGPLMPRLRRSEAARAVLAAVNAAVVALIAAVLIDLARATLITPWSWGLCALAVVAGLRWRVPGWGLVLVGAAAGFLSGI
jgi:chromate transporter